MKKGIKFRAYPNKAQENLINQTFGCCRLIYNRGLAMREERYENGQSISYAQTCKLITELKKQPAFNFLKIVDSIALQQALKDLNQAYVNFFQKRTGHPKFKSKHDRHQSYRTLNGNNKTNIRLEGNKIKLPKLGFLKIKPSMEIDSSKINNVTIERKPSGKYFVIINVDFELEFKPRTNNNQIGIDVGLKHFYTDSNGDTVENPRFLENSSKQLARAQRRLSRKQKGSKNYEKQRVKVAKIHEKIANQRTDFLQKQSTMLVRENQTICIEDLKIKNMVRNHKLAKAISSVSWSMFFNMLSYKSAWYGCQIIKVPTYYPSSQTCSQCGYQNTKVKNLNIRKWECPTCHTVHDRDLNASINILQKGLSLI